MKLRSVKIKNFRRFTDLTVKNIPETARLIMLAGPNGCGKSSFFDALHTWCRQRTHVLWEADYHGKDGSPVSGQLTDEVRLEFHNWPLQTPEEKRGVIYARSAYRNEPDFNITEITKLKKKTDEINVKRMIDNDMTIKNNYLRLVSNALEDIFERLDGASTIAQFRTEMIDQVRNPFIKLFPDLKFNSLGNPIKEGTFRFAKGISKNFSFKNLSSGEKAVFDLILDLIIARREYNNTVFCIDEPESHINPRLHARLLEVLYNLIPENCQLILATHSIGMMRRARDIESVIPGSVVFLDFGGRDFDKDQVIEPTKIDRTFWKKAYEIALADLAALLAPERVIICEGQPIVRNAVGNHSHDAKCYETIFEDEFPETRFISMGNDQQIIGDQRGLAEALLSLVDNIEVIRLVDRDRRSDNEKNDLAKKGVRVLSRYNLETYLFDDELLRALAIDQRQEEKIQVLLDEKKRILESEPTESSDNLKPAAGQVYVACRKILNLTKCGNDCHTFMRDTLAPLVKPHTKIYKELRRDIFGS